MSAVIDIWNMGVWLALPPLFLGVLMKDFRNWLFKYNEDHESEVIMNGCEMVERYDHDAIEECWRKAQSVILAKHPIVRFFHYIKTMFDGLD